MTLIVQVEFPKKAHSQVSRNGTGHDPLLKVLDQVLDQFVIKNDTFSTSIKLNHYVLFGLKQPYYFTNALNFTS